MASKKQPKIKLTKPTVVMVNCHTCGIELLSKRHVMQVQECRKLGYKQPVAFLVRGGFSYCRCCVTSEGSEEEG